MSAIERYFHSVMSAPGRDRSRTSLHQAGALVRQGGTGLLVGGVLGAAHASEGLDIKGKVPADLLLAVAGSMVAVSMSDEDFAHDARNVATDALVVFGFRQGYGFVAEKKKASGGAPAGGFTPLKFPGFHGDFGSAFGAEGEEDPILSIAREFD